MSGASLFESFTQDRCPSWTCPGCMKETLRIVPGSFFYRKTADTLTHEKEHYFDFYYVEYIFSCLLECELTGCSEPVAVTGRGWLTEDNSYDHRSQTLTESIPRFEARAFYPPLPLFIPPEDCPVSVIKELCEISALLNAHPSAATNAIRRLLETLLDEMTVPREIPREGKSPVKLKLHDRIERYPDILGEHQRGVMALKYLGNTGSHENKEIERQSLDDACQILENIIRQLYPSKPDLTLQIERLERDHKPKPQHPGVHK